MRLIASAVQIPLALHLCQYVFAQLEAMARPMVAGQGPTALLTILDILNILNQPVRSMEMETCLKPYLETEIQARRVEQSSGSALQTDP
jgi:hypothetical protein